MKVQVEEMRPGSNPTNCSMEGNKKNIIQD
jgi:hypothetical protein